MAFVPFNFIPPDKLRMERFTLRMLSVNDVVKDYEAVMSSLNHLRKLNPFGPDSEWPSMNLTLEQNLIDLGWHQKEFQRKTSFTYTIVTPDDSKCLGCLYIYPSSNPNYDAMVILWTREGEKNSGLNEYVFREAKKWINEEFPFKRVAYPGRETEWDVFCTQIN